MFNMSYELLDDIWLPDKTAVLLYFSQMILATLGSYQIHSLYIWWAIYRYQSIFDSQVD